MRFRARQFAINKIASPNHLPSKMGIFEGADDGIRTHTPLSRERILSPLRLPFRHIGAHRHSKLLLQAAKMDFEMSRRSR